MISDKSKKLRLGLSPEMERLYGELRYVSNLGCGMATGDWPLLNVYKSLDGALIEALVPGIQASDIRLSISDRILTIEKDVVPYSVRKNARVFFRTVELPFDIDLAGSTVHCSNGLLRIILHRRQTESSSSDTSQTDGSVRISTDNQSGTPIQIPVVFEPKKTVRLRSTELDFVEIPKTNIVENQAAYLMVVELPGIPFNCIKISRDNKALVIEAKKPQFLLQQLTTVYSEFETGSYRRRWSLLDDIDVSGISALFMNGTLQVRLPKQSPD